MIANPKRKVAIDPCTGASDINVAPSAGKMSTRVIGLSATAFHTDTGVRNTSAAPTAAKTKRTKMPIAQLNRDESLRVCSSLRPNRTETNIPSTVQKADMITTETIAIRKPSA